ncbi:MAG: MerR family transcriptional regulator [Sandaracinaceae bacterium]|nr:MerR family transcriptional regulator [Sandaracinaceae bacterium]
MSAESHPTEPPPTGEPDREPDRGCAPCRDRLPVVSNGTPLTSGDLARACHTTVRTVRFYEEAGLVEPVTRSEGGHRLYEPRQVPRLSLIIDLREAGLSLQDIKDLFELKHHAGSSVEASERMTAVLHRRIDEMQAKIACLRKLREELAQTATMIHECGTCSGEHFPSGCGHCDVMGRSDLPRAMRLLWGG